MIDFALNAAFGILTLAILLGMARLVIGPTVVDRIMAFDLVTTSSVGIIVLLCILWDAPVFLELVLIFSLLGFFATVAFVFYLSRVHNYEEADRRRQQAARARREAARHE